MHAFDSAMDSPLERARLATQLDRQLRAGEMSRAEQQHEMKTLEQLFGGRPDDKFIQALSIWSDAELRAFAASVPVWTKDSIAAPMETSPRGAGVGSTPMKVQRVEAATFWPMDSTSSASA